MKRLLLSFLLLTTPILLFGQEVKETAYKEFRIKNIAGRNYRIIPVKKGVISILESAEYVRHSKRKIIIRNMNHSLNALWEKTFKVEKLYRTIEVKYQENHLYFLLAKPSHFEYQILKIGLENGLSELIEYKPLENYFITHFSVAKDVFYFSGRLKNSPFGIIIDYKKNKITHLRSVNQLKAKIVNFQTNTLLNSINITLYRSYPTYERGLYFNEYDLKGKLRAKFFLPNESDYRLLTYRKQTKNNNEFMMLGTYALRNSVKTQGVYVMKFLKGKVVYSRFYDFFYFKNFFNYLKPKRKEKLLAKIKEKRKIGKKVKLDYRILLHQLLFREDKIILVGDAYRSSDDFRAERRPSVDLGHSDYGSYADPSLRRIMENKTGDSGQFVPSALGSDRPVNIISLPNEFGYTHSFACVFNEDGKLLWDNSFVFDDDATSSFPVEISGVALHKETLLFMAAGEKMLNFQVTEKSQKPDSLYFNEIPIPIVDDKISYFESGGIIPWYENHLLESGIKEINNLANSRKVFYIRKWSFFPKKKAD